MEISLNSSFSDIYKAYYQKALCFAKSYVHDDFVAEDIASEALITLWERMKSDEVEYVPSFLFTVLKNKSLDYLRREEVKLLAIESMSDWQSRELQLRIDALDACSPQDIFSADIERILHCTLQSLPEQTRQAFVLSRYQDKSNKEIACLLNISIKGVEYHISKALKVLRVALRDYLPLLPFLLNFPV